MLQHEIFTAFAADYACPLSTANLDARSPRFLICPMGLVGSGKSTCLTQILKCLPMKVVRVSTDELRRFVIQSGSTPCKREIDAAYLRLVRHLLSYGYPVACDSNCFRLREPISSLASEMGIKAFWFKVNPPEEYIVKKLRAFEHSWLFRDSDHAVERFYHHKNKNPTPWHSVSEPFSLDPSREDLFQQVSRMCDALLDCIGWTSKKRPSAMPKEE